MKRIMALTAAMSLLALFVLTSQANAQDGPSVSADPAAVAGPGSQAFALTGSGWNPGLFLFVVECTIPGDQLTTATPADDIAAVMSGVEADDCTQSPIGTAVVGGDGTFTANVTANVTANYGLGVGDAGRTQNGSVPILFIAEEPVEEAPC